MSKKLAEDLGLYFILFHKWYSGYVKCWLNGSDQAKLYSTDEFIALSQKSGLNYKLRLKIQDCLTESSIFLWDVENDVIKPLTPQQAESNLGEVLQQKSAEMIKELHHKKKEQPKLTIFNIPLFKRSDR